MKNEELYLRIQNQRLSRKNRDIIPFTNFCDKTERSERLLKLIVKRIKDKASLKEARIQFVISDVTAFEVYFKDLFQAIYLFYECQKEFLDKCEKLVDKKFDFQDLVKIIFENYDLSDIVMEHQNFQNLSAIDKTFSVILKEKFWDSLHGQEFKVPEQIESWSLPENWYPNLEKYLKLRHDLTHDYNPKFTISLEKIWDLHFNMVAVVNAIEIVFVEEIFEPNVMKVERKRVKIRKLPSKGDSCIFAYKKAVRLQDAIK